MRDHFPFLYFLDRRPPHRYMTVASFWTDGVKSTNIFVGIIDPFPLLSFLLRRKKYKSWSWDDRTRLRSYGPVKREFVKDDDQRSFRKTASFERESPEIVNASFFKFPRIYYPRVIAPTKRSSRGIQNLRVRGLKYSSRKSSSVLSISLRRDSDRIVRLPIGKTSSRI